MASDYETWAHLWPSRNWTTSVRSRQSWGKGLQSKFSSFSQLGWVLPLDQHYNQLGSICRILESSLACSFLSFRLSHRRSFSISVLPDNPWDRLLIFTQYHNSRMPQSWCSLRSTVIPCLSSILQSLNLKPHKNHISSAKDCTSV